MEFIVFVEKVAEFEGCPNTNGICYKYRDSAGVETIGYGFTNKALVNRRDLTVNDAKKILYDTLLAVKNDTERTLEKYNYMLEENEVLALTSFVYNCGQANLLKLINYGKRTRSEITEKIILYNKAGGVTLAGLQRRRLWEQSLFLDAENESVAVLERVIDCLRNSFCVNEIKLLQNTLNNHGANLIVDGVAGTRTADALRNLFVNM